MIEKIIRAILTVTGILVGLAISYVLLSSKALNLSLNWQIVLLYLIGALIFGLIFYFLAGPIYKIIGNFINWSENRLDVLPISDVLLAVVGLIIGFFIAFLLSQPILKIDIPLVGSTISTLLSIILYLIFGVLGVRLALKNKEDVYAFFNRVKQSDRGDRRERGQRGRICPKILDTSTLIDGRICGVIEAGFLEGPIIISQFVLEELQHIADSTDTLRRERGRRGLDGVKRIQEMEGIETMISNEEYPNIKEVDHKLLKLTEDLDGKIVTTDYNLNKVADVQGIEVLNINDLANAVKAVVIPGEKMHVSIIKEGKEQNQGVAYLDDGTMIVIENGKKFIGSDRDVVVTSVLQTSAGKMIFARIDS